MIYRSHTKPYYPSYLKGYYPRIGILVALPPTMDLRFSPLPVSRISVGTYIYALIGIGPITGRRVIDVLIIAADRSSALV